MKWNETTHYLHIEEPFHKDTEDRNEATERISTYLKQGMKH